MWSLIKPRILLNKSQNNLLSSENLNRCAQCLTLQVFRIVSIYDISKNVFCLKKLRARFKGYVDVNIYNYIVVILI